MSDLTPLERPDVREAVPIGELAQTALKRAVMASWEAGSITNLEAWWIIQREGLQHK